MQINLEHLEKYSVQGYSDNQIKIDNEWYSNNLLVSRMGIITDWKIKSIQDIDEDNLNVTEGWVPEVIIIGHMGGFVQANPELISTLSQKRIGLEIMQLDAACRTYNVLIGEQRDVLLGIIWKHEEAGP